MKSKLENILDDMTQLRDELILKADLGKAEAKDELEKLNPTLDVLKDKTNKIASISGDSAKQIALASEMGIKADSKEELDIALELAADELKKGYEKIKKLL